MPISTTATDSEDDQHTLTEEQLLRSAPSPLNRLRLKVPRLPFLKKRTSIRERHFSPKSPSGKFFGASVSSPAPSTLSLSFFVDALKNSPRLGKRRATQRPTVEPEALSSPFTSPGPRDLTSDSSSASSQSYDCERGQSVIVKALPSITEVPELVKGWRKLPPRLPIPKWDVDD